VTQHELRILPPVALCTQFLGETLDAVFKKAGVLVEVSQEAQEAQM
jgi:hypothetical protein